ncbi:PREDICTED: MAM and LDL-receptor class A domain-containing protein 1-like [Branchiostoma belcheri]|uniref:MAM and LDL-receptor class A domain-containing protein 1-like n=1 Tax=Branchiostoma belcheri TaxID=7741 RepID=A0A6P5AIS0_BRABE|nr:PREDICTED: MAM and LDL-receptor class A domain-containing protein 1-like [Branchiostoma belcheri]
MYRIIFARKVNYVMLGLTFAHLWTLSIQQGGCDFDTNMCGFQQDSRDNFDWTRQQGSTGTANTGPSADHTTGSGYYMFIETSSPQETGHIARLISPVLSTDTKCLEFWYHMYGDSTDDLNVYIRPTGRPLPGSLTWSQTGDKGDVWKRARVHVEAASDFNIVFEGVRGSSYRGDIAIDDVSFRTTPCGGDCDFDASLCGYQQDSTDDFDWTRQQGNTGTVNTGPSLDHTTGSSVGSYMYIETSTPRQPGDIARLISPVLSSDTRCLEFWYHMYGDGVEELRVYQSSSDSSQLGTPLWSLTGDQGDVWHNATVGLAQGSSFYIVFEAVRGSTARGDIAIDDVSGRTTSCAGPVVTTTLAAPVTTVTVATVDKSTTDLATAAAETTTPLQVTTPESSTQRVTTEMESTTSAATTQGPTTTEAVPSERDCDFNTDVCGYQQDNTDDFDWARKYGSTSTTGTGPGSDHTTGNGYYMYIEASSPQVRGDIARLITPALPTNTRCLEFWYHMYGSSTGDLRVYQRPTGSAQLGTPIWSLAGDQGNVWDQARLDIAAVNNFQIVFEGVRGSSLYGDIAIDDVSFRSTPCGDGSCTFDASLCGYQQDNTDDFDWTRQQGSTGTTNTGPSSDHTTGSGKGYYMYIETSGLQSGDIARLSSPVLSTDIKCLEFWYHMYGTSTGELNVYQRFTGSAELGTPVWSQTGDQGDAWKQATVDLVTDKNFYVVFEGVRGTSYRGDIAIDDVSYRTTPCVATTVAITTTTVATTAQRTTTDVVTTNPVTTADTTTTLLQTTTSTSEPSTEDTTTEEGHTTPEPSTTYITTTTPVTTQEATTATVTTPEYTSTAMDTTTDATTSTQQALATTEPITTSVVTTDETTLELTTAPDTTSIITTEVTTLELTTAPDTTSIITTEVTTLELTTAPDTTSVITTEVTTLELTTAPDTTTILPTTITTTQHTSSPDVQPTTSSEETTERSPTTTVDSNTPLQSTTHVATTIEEETTSTPSTTVTPSTILQTTVPRETTTPTHEHSSATTNIATTKKPSETSLPSASTSTTELHQTTTTKSSTVKPDQASTATLTTLKPEPTKASTKKPVTVQPESEAQDGGLSIGIIIGAGAGGAVVVILLVVVIVIVFKCRKSNRQKNQGWETANPMYDVAMGPMINGNKPGYGGDVYSNNNKNGGKMDEDFYAFNMDTSNV